MFVGLTVIRKGNTKLDLPSTNSSSGTSWIWTGAGTLSSSALWKSSSLRASSTITPCCSTRLVLLDFILPSSSDANVVTKTVLLSALSSIGWKHIIRKGLKNRILAEVCRKPLAPPTWNVYSTAMNSCQKFSAKPSMNRMRFRWFLGECMRWCTGLEYSCFCWDIKHFLNLSQV